MEIFCCSKKECWLCDIPCFSPSSKFPHNFQRDIKSKLPSMLSHWIRSFRWLIFWFCRIFFSLHSDIMLPHIKKVGRLKLFWKTPWIFYICKFKVGKIAFIVGFLLNFNYSSQLKLQCWRCFKNISSGYCSYSIWTVSYFFLRKP